MLTNQRTYFYHSTAQYCSLTATKDKKMCIIGYMANKPYNIDMVFFSLIFLKCTLKNTYKRKKLVIRAVVHVVYPKTNFLWMNYDECTRIIGETYFSVKKETRYDTERPRL